MAKVVHVSIGNRVQHRAWLWTGTVTEVPSGEVRHMDTVTVLQDGEQNTEKVWLPSLIINTSEFIYDWSDIVAKSTKRKAKSKSKKPKHKG